VTAVEPADKPIGNSRRARRCCRPLAHVVKTADACCRQSKPPHPRRAGESVTLGGKHDLCRQVVAQGGGNMRNNVAHSRMIFISVIRQRARPLAGYRRHAGGTLARAG
jgi:hypothetical protein